MGTERIEKLATKYNTMLAEIDNFMCCHGMEDNIDIAAASFQVLKQRMILDMVIVHLRDRTAINELVELFNETWNSIIDSQANYYSKDELKEAGIRYNEIVTVCNGITVEELISLNTININYD